MCHCCRRTVLPIQLNSFLRHFEALAVGNQVQLSFELIKSDFSNN